MLISRVAEPAGSMPAQTLTVARRRQFSSARAERAPDCRSFRSDRRKTGAQIRQELVHNSAGRRYETPAVRADAGSVVSGTRLRADCEAAAFARRPGKTEGRSRPAVRA